MSVDYTQLPTDLPVPVDDGAADGLVGREVPEVLGLSDLAVGLLVAYVYPMTGTPGKALPHGWDDIPGARGCTPQSCAYRDALGDFERLGASVVGISAQSPVEQAEFAAREHIPFPLLSDAGLTLHEALGLPTFEVEGRPLYRRLTFVAAEGRIVKVFYPVFPPDRDAAEVLAWLRDRVAEAGSGLMSALAETIAIEGRVLRHVLDLDLAPAVPRLEGAERVWLVGTGTSEHAACLGASMLATAGFDARVSSAARFVAEPPRLGPDDALVVISHTTETAFARRVREDALEAGTRLLTITAEGKDWPEAIEAAPPERSETYTASYLAVLLVFARLTVALGGEEWGGDELAALPGLVEGAGVEPLAIESPPSRLTVLFGAGPAAVTAREGALKLREASRVLAEGFEAEYLLHGSAVPLRSDDHLVAIDPDGDPSGLTASLADAAEREGIPVARLDPPPDLHPLLAQLPLTVRFQSLASRWADRQGIDPDTVILGAWADQSLWSLGAPGAESSRP